MKIYHIITFPISKCFPRQIGCSWTRLVVGKCSLSRQLNSHIALLGNLSYRESLPLCCPIQFMSDRCKFDLNAAHACEEAIGYTFHDSMLLWEALQADGSVPCMFVQGRCSVGNKRLAIVCGRVLDLLLACKCYPGHFETAVFDDMRHDVTTNDSLESIGNRNQLERFITRTPGVV